ncbi:hypothetical protein [Actinokineospora bangkokensis]|uniref:DUF3558 domain-containing protein n=1 Tax=Actinokineospora bangkokensis TaxID=1193682 RepID=A0A1Q9LRL8_9PSEU|nr:hypothetical protein [Actinokineospora bangkokensis]OLR94660.1 hypothetical protein BJP25_13140 [Actinokineospora bangkokensis]
MSMKRLVLAVAVLAATAACNTPLSTAPTPSRTAPIPTPAGSAEETGSSAPEPSESSQSSEPEPGSDEGGSAEGIHGCDVLEKADAEKLAGIAVQDGVEGPLTEPSCTYTSPPDGRTAQVELYLGGGAKKFLDIDRELDHEFVDVPGIGDEAVLEDNTLFFRVGSTWAALRLVRLDNEPADNAPGLKALGKKLAGRL